MYMYMYSKGSGQKGSGFANDRRLRPRETTKEYELSHSIILQCRTLEAPALSRMTAPATRNKQFDNTEDDNLSPLRAISGEVRCPRRSQRKDPQTRRSRSTYSNDRIRYNSWLANKGWRGTIADNRVPPRGAVGEPRRILSTNTTVVSSRMRYVPAASKPLERPRDQVEFVGHDNSTRKQ